MNTVLTDDHDLCVLNVLFLAAVPASTTRGQPNHSTAAAEGRWCHPDDRIENSHATSSRKRIPNPQASFVCSIIQRFNYSMNQLFNDSIIQRSNHSTSDFRRVWRKTLSQYEGEYFHRITIEDSVGYFFSLFLSNQKSPCSEPSDRILLFLLREL